MKKGLIFIWKVMVLVLFVAWVCIVFTDYFRTKNEKTPMFCIKEQVYNYDDGTTYECIGLGYKMYKYDRQSISATEFGPIFIEQRTSIN
jgi:hypothetical protein